MARPMQETRFELARRELLAIEAACGHVVRCEAGELWITVDGPRDIVLGPGESYRAEGKGAAVISALRPAELTVTRPEHCAEARKEGAEWTLAGLLRWKAAPLAGSPATRIG